MGIVFLTFQRALKRYVALKQMRLRTPGATAQQRFLREANAAAILAHPGIVSIFDSGVEAGVPWYAMEYVSGGDLAGRIERPEGFAVTEEIVRLIVQVADAVAHAHRCGIAHRDLKPSNILLSEDGSPKVADFGLARLAHPAETITLSGEILGTPAYMAPELLNGIPATFAAACSADVYSLGAILFHLLSNRTPYPGRSVPEQLGAMTKGPDPTLAGNGIELVLPPRLVALCERSIARDPSARPPTVAVFAEVLKASLGEPARRVRPSLRRRFGRPFAISAIALAATIVVATIVETVRTPKRAVCLVMPVSTSPGADIPSIMAPGLQDEVVAAMQRITDLAVILPSSASQLPPRTDARLQLRLSRWQDNYRVTAVLESIPRGLVLWSETFDRPTSNIFDLQTDIAVHVASALKARFAPDRASRQLGTSSPDPQAEALYLQAKVRQADGSASVVQLSKAEADLRKAIGLDGQFAGAFAELSRVETLQYAWSNDRTPARLQDALRNAQAALRINPLLLEGEVALGDYFLRASKNFPLARLHFEAALKIAPQNKDALTGLASLLRRQGDFGRSAALFRDAMEADPNNALLAFNTVTAFMWLRDYEQASALLDEALSYNPRHVALLKIRGDLYVAWKGDLGPMTADILHRDPALPTPDLYLMDKIEWLVLSGKGTQALQALQASGFKQLDGQAIYLDRLGYEALIRSWLGDKSGAAAAASRDLPQAEATLRQRPNDSRVVLFVGQLETIARNVDAGVSRMRRTVTPGDPACADAWDQGFYLRAMAVQLACASRSQEALTTVQHILHGANPYSLAALRLHPALTSICRIIQ